MHTCATVVVGYNNSSTLEKCLLAAEAHCLGDGYHIAMIDNGSTDDTETLIKEKFPKIDFRRREDNVGFGNANNQIFDEVEAKYYFLLNSDAYMQDGSLKDAITHLDANPDISIAGLPLVFPDQSPQTSAYSFTTPQKMTLQLLGIPWLIKKMISIPALRKCIAAIAPKKIAKTFLDTHTGQDAIAPGGGKEVDWVCGAAMIIRGDFIKKHGGFDPKIFLYGEDEDICIRARETGGRVEQLQITPVIHEFGWGKRKKKSKFFAPKYTSLVYCFNKRYGKNTLKACLSILVLRLQMMGLRGFLPGTPTA